MDLDIIFFIGPQGSGKGTQAKRLAASLGFFYWEMGGILRDVSHENSDMGRRAAELHDQGILFPDDFLIEIVKMKLNLLPADTGIIFDGIPRRLGQAEFLMDYLKQRGRKNFLTLYISLPREESVNRLLLRAKAENRKDDTLEGIETRLKYYENDTTPVLDFLKTCTTFVEIDGKPPVEEVAKMIDTALNLQIS